MRSWIGLVLAMATLALVGCAETGVGTGEEHQAAVASTESTPVETAATQTHESTPPPEAKREESAPAEGGHEEGSPEHQESESSCSPPEDVGSTCHAEDAKFCSEHSCIGNFENGRGEVVECADGDFSHSGGIQGACSDHGGEAGG